MPIGRTAHRPADRTPPTWRRGTPPIRNMACGRTPAGSLMDRRAGYPAHMDLWNMVPGARTPPRSFMDGRADYSAHMDHLVPWTLDKDHARIFLVGRTSAPGQGGPPPPGRADPRQGGRADHHAKRTLWNGQFNRIYLQDLLKRPIIYINGLIGTLNGSMIPIHESPECPHWKQVDK